MKPTKICLFVLALNIAPVARYFSPLVLAQPLPERRVLSGRITDDAGNPLPRINITLQRENDLGAHAFWGTVAVTDAQGRYRIDNAEDGAYLISAEGENFSNVQNQHLRLDANSTIWNAQLQRLTNLLVLLKDAEGKVLPKARVAVRLSKSSTTDAGINSVAFARKMQRRAITTDKGELQMPNIEPGTYKLELALPGVGFASIDSFSVKYEAQPIAHEVQLQHGGDVKLIARENGEDGRWLGGAVLTLGEDIQITAEQRAQGTIARQGAMDLGNLYAWSADGSRAATSDGDGAIELQDLAPGHYTARLVLPGYAPADAQNFEVQSGQNQTLIFDLKPRTKNASTKFQVQDAEGAPLANRDWTLQLRSVQPAPTTAAAPAAPATALPELPDIVTIAPPTANLALPLEAPLEIAPAPPGALELQMEGGGLAGFSGVVTRRVRSDDKGQFTLYPLQPGQWTLMIFATPTDDQSPRGSFLQQTLNISADNGKTIVLKLEKKF